MMASSKSSLATMALGAAVMLLLPSLSSAKVVQLDEDTWKDVLKGEWMVKL